MAEIWQITGTFVLGGGIGVLLTWWVSMSTFSLKRRMDATEQFLQVAAQAHARSRSDAQDGTGLGEMLAAIALVAGLGNDFKFLRNAAIDVLVEIRTYTGEAAELHRMVPYGSARSAIAANASADRYLRMIKGFVETDNSQLATSPA